MKRLFACMSLPLMVILITTSSCQRSSDEVWNDTKSAGRHVSRGVQTLGGKNGVSRQINSPDDFLSDNELELAAGADYVAFEEEQNGSGMRVGEAQDVMQSKETPGEIGSSIPGIDQFKDPSSDPELASIFQNLHFEYNSSLIKGDENLSIINRIAEWMKSHPNAYLFVEGHCDSRGPAAFNFALGANRANAVRNLLIKEGVPHDHVFPISYGKERPLAEGEGEDIWTVNRRAQFKIYEKT